MSGNLHVFFVFLRRISLFSCFLAASLLFTAPALGQADQGTIIEPALAQSW